MSFHGDAIIIQLKMKLIWTICLVASFSLIRLSSTRTLTIEGPIYTELPPIYGDNITVIRIVDTNIQVIKSHSFDNVSDTLEQIYIDDNGLLEEIEYKAFYELNVLHTLEILYSYSLKDLHEDLFRTTSNLRTLKIKYSPSVVYPPKLTYLEYLEILDLTDTGLAGWSEATLSNNKHLKAVVLSENQDLWSIPSESFSQQTKLQTLHFSDCHLRTLYPDYFHMSDDWKEIKGTGNPWNCESMCEFVKWMDDAFKNKTDFGTCSKPSELNGELVISLTRKEACPFCCTALVVFLSFLFLPILFGGFIFLLSCFVDECKSCDEPRRNQTEPHATDDDNREANDDNANAPQMTSSSTAREDNLNFECEVTPAGEENSTFECEVKLDEDCTIPSAPPPPPAYDEI